MRKREEILEEAEKLTSGLYERDRLKLEVMLDIREILDDIKDLKKRQMGE